MLHLFKNIFASTKIFRNKGKKCNSMPVTPAIYPFAYKGSYNLCLLCINPIKADSLKKQTSVYRKILQLTNIIA
jgi:hypothetical protein